MINNDVIYIYIYEILLTKGGEKKETINSFESPQPVLFLVQTIITIYIYSLRPDLNGQRFYAMFKYLFIITARLK
jgi:hypothetical protein